MTTGQRDCACGCGKSTGSTSTYYTGCDKELVVSIARNDPELLARVDWDRVGTGFYKGKLSQEVEWHLRYQERLREVWGLNGE